MTSTDISTKSSFRSRDDIHVLAAILAVTAWGIGPIFNKALSVSTSSIVFYRMLLGLPIMIVMAYMNGGSLNKHVIRKAALPGFMFAMSFITGFATVKMTSIANATMVGTLQPVLVLFVAPKLFGEKITKRKLMYSVSALAGVLVVVMAAASTSGAHLDGDLLAVLNVFIWTTYFVMSKKRRDEGIHSWSFIAAVFLCASIIVLPYGALTSNDLGAMHVSDWWYIIGMALGPGVIGHGMMTWAQGHIDVSLASLLGLISPVISSILAWFFFQQSLTLLQLLGGVIVLASLTALVRLQGKMSAETLVVHET
ncbi:MAG: EamA family transporter [Ilumatobacteraceae bacterium]|nr:EamA family transporter [Ilumatobacteraceae bacterium]